MKETRDLNARDIERILTGQEPVDPPAGLRDRLRADIPDPLPSVTPEKPRGRAWENFGKLAALLLLAFAARAFWESNHPSTVPEPLRRLPTETIAFPSQPRDIPLTVKRAKSLPESLLADSKSPAPVPPAIVARNPAPEQEASSLQQKESASSDRKKDETAETRVAAQVAPSPATSSNGVFYQSAPADAFVDADSERFSTFGLDVDTASYALGRRYLSEGRLPPPASVRVEEYVNSFDYGDPAPERGDVALRLEGGPSPFERGVSYRIVRVNVRAREAAARDDSEAIFGSDAVVRVEFHPGAVARFRMIGYENRPGGGRTQAESPAGGKIRAGKSVTALYEVQLKPPQAEPTDLIATAELSYRSARTGKDAGESAALRRNAIARSWAKATPAFRLSTLVAEYAEILRGSSHAKSLSLERVAQQTGRFARESRGNPAVEELFGLTQRAAKLTTTLPAPHS
jgi:hypothetical protein